MSLLADAVTMCARGDTLSGSVKEIIKLCLFYYLFECCSRFLRRPPQRSITVERVYRACFVAGSKDVGHFENIDKHFPVTAPGLEAMDKFHRIYK